MRTLLLLLLSTSALAQQTTIDVPNIYSGYTWGLRLRNPTLATDPTTNQRPPALVLEGQGWSPGTGSEAVRNLLQTIPISTTHAYALLQFSTQRAIDANPTPMMNLSRDFASGFLLMDWLNAPGGAFFRNSSGPMFIRARPYNDIESNSAIYVGPYSGRIVNAYILGIQNDLGAGTVTLGGFFHDGGVRSPVGLDAPDEHTQIGIGTVIGTKVVVGGGVRGPLPFEVHSNAVTLDVPTASTASAGTATLPEHPVGFITIYDTNGVVRKIPYYGN